MSPDNSAERSRSHSGQTITYPFRGSVDVNETCVRSTRSTLNVRISFSHCGHRTGDSSVYIAPPALCDLLEAGGRLVLIEGYWSTGGGLHAAEILEALPPSLTQIAMQNLSTQSAYWGGEVSDERYTIIANLRP